MGLNDFDRLTTPHKQVHEIFAERIMEGLQNGNSFLTKSWQPGELAMPINAVTGKPYSGVNALHLLSEGLDDPRFCTLKQAHDAGWKVQEGEQSRPVIFWSNTINMPERDQNGQAVYDEDGLPKVSTVELERPICKVVHVFHVSQLEGDIPPHEPRDMSWDARWDAYERAASLLTSADVDIQHDQKSRAFYAVQHDEIHLPSKDRFADTSLYYSTALHELGHATRHPHRLDRQSGPFGSPDYAKEELRVEIASFMLGASLGLGFNPDRHQAYIKDWIEVLQKDPYELVRACRDAELIKEHVMSYEPEQQLSTEQLKIIVRETGELHSLPIGIADGSTLRDRDMLMFSLPQAFGSMEYEFDTSLKAYTCSQSTYEDLCVDVDEHNKDVEKENREYAESKARSKEAERQKAEKLGIITIPTKDRQLQQATVEARLRAQVQDSAPVHETTKKQVQPLAKSHGMER